MEVAKVDAVRRFIIYWAVRLFGGRAFRRRDLVCFVRIPPEDL